MEPGAKAPKAAVRFFASGFLGQGSPSSCGGLKADWQTCQHSFNPYIATMGGDLDAN